jgi:hypothetical protein
MNGLQAAGAWRVALTIVLAIYVTTTTLRAQLTVVIPDTSSAARIVDQLSRRGVFEGPNDEYSRNPASADDYRIRWLTFYLIYADDALSLYAPGGAAGARFDLFQFAGFPEAQPFGYPIHIVVTNRRTTLLGVVNTVADKQLAEVRAREVPHVVSVKNALAVAP